MIQHDFNMMAAATPFPLVDLIFQNPDSTLTNASSLHLFVSLASKKKMRPLLQEAGYHKSNVHPEYAFPKPDPLLPLPLPKGHLAVSEASSSPGAKLRTLDRDKLPPSFLSSYSRAFKNTFPFSLCSCAQISPFPLTWTPSLYSLGTVSLYRGSTKGSLLCLRCLFVHSLVRGSANKGPWAKCGSLPIFCTVHKLRMFLTNEFYNQFNDSNHELWSHIKWNVVTTPHKTRNPSFSLEDLSYKQMYSVTIIRF